MAGDCRCTVIYCGMQRRRIHSNGYILVGGEYEHRLVAAQMLGRPLRTDEHVHHINGDKTDNRPINLEVCDPSEHIRKYHNAGYWTDEMDAVLREKRSLGWSYGEIAKHLGLRTSAIGTRVHRLLVQGDLTRMKVGRKARPRCARGHEYEKVGYWLSAQGHRHCKRCRAIWRRNQRGRSDRGRG
jgi:hypothetical protein